MYKIDDGHLVSDCKYIPTSANSGLMMDLPKAIVLHYTSSSKIQSTINFFQNKKNRASSHLIIDRDGSIVQMIPLNHIAWHAGRSEFQGLSSWNKFSIGIELVNAGLLKKVGTQFQSWYGRLHDESEVIALPHKHRGYTEYWQTYTEEQIEALNNLIETLKDFYPIEFIVGHDDIAEGRKIDPGPALPMEAIVNRAFGNRETDEAEHVCIQETKKMGVPATVDVTHLNFRSTPVVSNNIISEPLERGTFVTILETQGKWAKIEVKKEGWVARRFLKGKE